MCNCNGNKYGKQYYIENNYGEKYKPERTKIICSDNMMQNTDKGGKPFVTNIMRKAGENSNFRIAVWTGNNLQMTLMCIPPHSDIGLERHETTDQMLRVESGVGVVRIGTDKNQMSSQQKISVGDVVFVPAGTWHNIINNGDKPLKLSSVYAPPNHKKGIVQATKEDARRAE